MAPARKKKAAANVNATVSPPAVSALPLQGCCIAFSGIFPSRRTQASLFDLAERLGATTSKVMTDTVTHLVTTQTDCDKPAVKVSQANDLGIPLVGLQWLLEAEEIGAKQPEADYILTARDYRAASSTDPPVNSQTKRAVSPDTSAPDPKKKKLELVEGKVPAIGEAQIAKDWSVKVPVDEGCSLQGYGVYVDDDSIIYDATLNQTNAGKNANKFYRIQVLVGPNNDCKAWTRWGRVGESGQHAILGSGALADAITHFESKFKTKTGLAWENRADTPRPKKYVFLERNYDSNSDESEDEAAPNANGTKSALEERKPPSSTLDPAVQGLMQLIFNQKYFSAAMADMHYDSEKMPLGKLSKATILRGFQTLKDLSVVLQNSAPTNGGAGVEDLSNLFYSIIPHVFGRDRPPVINSEQMVKREIELLETLADMKDAANILKQEVDSMNRVHPLDRQFNGLGLREMTPLDPNKAEYQLLERYLVDTRGATHHLNYEVEDIFRIERNGEKDRFDQSVFAGPVRDRRLLWHGSRVTNFGGILSQGLRIAPPEAPVSGYMFDKGVYLADMSSKSANYCCSYISDNTALLLLCEAELGKPMQELSNSRYNAAETAKAAGCWSTFGKGGTGPSLWKDASCLHSSLAGVKMPSTRRVPPGPTKVPSSLLYNEYICYDVAQIRLRYLFRVKMH